MISLHRFTTLQDENNSKLAHPEHTLKITERQIVR